MTRGLRTLTSRAASIAALAVSLLLIAVTAWAAPEKASGGIRFTYHDANAATVAWAGAFNNWSTSANPMTKGAGGVWTVVVALPPGEQQYKFVVDGQWVADPENGTTAGEFGNSVVKVGADGGLLTQAVTSNTAYSAKIAIDGRTHALFLERFDPTTSRYELSRPLFDIDLGFGVRISDLLKGRILTNIDPQKEDVQDYRSRLNFKRGTLDFQQPDLRILAFDSETIPTWDDPARLVGDIGIYRHPYGYQRNGFLVASPKLGFDTQVLYADNSSVGGTEFPGGSTINDFSLDRGTNRKFVFTGDAYGDAWKQLRAYRKDASTFALVPHQVSKITTTDVGDNGQSFGYGDGAENTFAASVRRQLPGGLRVGVLGRSDRGFHLGRLVLAETLTDTTGTLTYGQTEQEWFAGGVDALWNGKPGVAIWAEFLQGARRLDMMDRASRVQFLATGITGTGAAGITTTGSDTPLGQHYNLDESRRMLGGASWSFASNDVTVRAEVEHQEHRYPTWSQPPVAPAGLSNVDHQQFENVDFQRAAYTDSRDVENAMTEVRLGWDRNWRYYLGREVKSSMNLELTTFDYDPRTSWEYQMWFPTGNFWLEQNGTVAGPDRLVVLGEKHVFRFRPSLDVPIRRARDIRFRFEGTYSGTKIGLRPRYSESIFQFGGNLNHVLRLTNDTRWVKYDAPALSLNRSWFSQFTELRYQFAEGIHVGIGWGVSPNVIDPVTNEFANIGRDVFLSDRNANGYVAEHNWLSLAPQIAAAERALQNERRLQFEAVVRF